MKNTYIFMCLLFLAGISVQSFAQTDPGTVNLKHQWTFDDGTAKDIIGGADGTLVGAAVISGNALNTSAGGYLEFPGATIAINTYTGFTMEAWFTSSSGVNSGCTMLSYFGNTVGSYGTDYVFMGPANCQVTKVAISCGNTSEPWTVENIVRQETGYIDDGKLHHMVGIVDATSISFYIDGIFIGATELTGTNSLSAVNPTFAYLCKGGYTGDPTWRGQIHKFSIFDKALTGDEVYFLFQKGAEEKQVISASVTQMVFDNSQPAVMFTVTGKNLLSDITVTPPAGIIIDPASIAANAEDFAVTAIWDGVTAVNDTVVLSSGTALVKIPVKSADDSNCYTPLYPDLMNLVIDPGMNSLANFQGWGSRNVVTIFNEPENVYCGASSISIGNGTGRCSGSLDILGGATSILEPNTTYRVRFMIKTIGGSYKFGADIDPTVTFDIDTKGEWMALDTIFTTGATIGNNIFINSCESNTGLIAYVDNFEIYHYFEPVISASVKSIVFDPEYNNLQMTVTSTNLTEEILLSAPAGILLSTNILPAESVGDIVEIVHDGITPVDGNITLTSGTYTVNIPVKYVSASNVACFEKLFADRTNLVPDPYLNNPLLFSGWGGKSHINVVNDPDSVYCGSHSGKVVGGGSLDVILTGILLPNTSYVARAVVRTFGGPFQIGVWGIDNVNTADVQDSIDTEGQWKHIILPFTTAELSDVQGMFFNNYQRTGQRGFIDNWELYAGEYSAVPKVDNKTTKVFVQNGRIVAEFNLDKPSNVEMAVYTLHGAMVANELHSLNAGKSTKLIDANLNSGVYIVKLTIDGQSSYAKVIK